MNYQKIKAELREMGFGNQAVIVGTKRVELYDFIEKSLNQQRADMIKKVEDMKGMSIKVEDKVYTHPVRERALNDVIKTLKK